MRTPSAKTLALCNEIIAASGPQPVAPLRALVARLAPTIGTVGIAALLQRSVALAKRKHAAFREIGGDLAALETFCHDERVAHDEARAFVAAALTTLLALLGTFVGNAFVVRIMRELWPDAVTSDFELTTNDEEMR